MSNHPATHQERTMLTTPDTADLTAAGRPFPMRDATVPMTYERAVDLIRARRDFWLAAASGYVRLAEAGCDDSLHDAREALAEAELYAPVATGAA